MVMEEWKEPKTRYNKLQFKKLNKLMYMQGFPKKMYKNLWKWPLAAEDT